jgi:hypothetical protein
MQGHPKRCFFKKAVVLMSIGASATVDLTKTVAYVSQ